MTIIHKSAQVYHATGFLPLLQIVGSTASATRRLQDTGIDPIVFPEIVTTGQLEWIADLEGDESSTTLCGTAFADDYSRWVYSCTIGGTGKRVGTTDGTQK